MSMQDPLADMLTRIRNGLMSKATQVSIPYSNIKKSIAKILVEEGYVESYEIHEKGIQKNIEVTLKYYRGRPVIEEITKVSRPGLRRYFGMNNIPYVRSGLGICILSTSKGVITDRQARELKVGGELICTVF